MHSAQQVIFDFVLAEAANQSPIKQAQLYRALGEFSGNEEQQRKLNALAESLEKVARKSQVVVASIHLKKP